MIYLRDFSFPTADAESHFFIRCNGVTSNNELVQSYEVFRTCYSSRLTLRIPEGLSPAMMFLTNMTMNSDRPQILPPDFLETFQYQSYNARFSRMDLNDIIDSML